MLDIIYSNRRITSRDNLNLHGKILLQGNNESYEEPIEITNISFDGIQVVFSNNDFFFKYLTFIEDININVIIQFKYEGEKYSFKHLFNWIKIFDFGERNFYVLTGLKFKNKEEIKDTLLELLLILKIEKYIRHR